VAQKKTGDTDIELYCWLYETRFKQLMKDLQNHLRKFAQFPDTSDFLYVYRLFLRRFVSNIVVLQTMRARRFFSLFSSVGTNCVSLRNN